MMPWWYGCVLKCVSLTWVLGDSLGVAWMLPWARIVVLAQTIEVWVWLLALAGAYGWPWLGVDGLVA